MVPGPPSATSNRTCGSVASGFPGRSCLDGYRTRFATSQAAKIESTQSFRQDLLGLPSALRPPVLTVLSLTRAPSTPHKTIRVFQTPLPESLGHRPIPGFGALGRLMDASLPPQNRPRPPRVTAPTLPNRAVPNHPIHLSEARLRRLSGSLMSHRLSVPQPGALLSLRELAQCMRPPQVHFHRGSALRLRTLRIPLTVDTLSVGYWTLPIRPDWTPTS